MAKIRTEDIRIVATINIMATGEPVTDEEAAQEKIAVRVLINAADDWTNERIMRAVSGAYFEMVNNG
jgi:hypothetical protein